MTDELTATQYSPNDYVVEVSFFKIEKLYPFDFADFPQLKLGDRVVAQTALGEQIGKVKRFLPRQDLQERTRLQRIGRLASPADLLVWQQWQERELPSLIDCRERASKMNEFNEVKFISAEYNFDGSQIIIFYNTHDFSRLNTGRLRGALMRQWDTRVEFRQIGAREVAKLQGGLGACGIPRCCSTFLTEFSTVTVGMAKAQGISLSTAELTGMCGRLRCCLIYEYEQYMEARRQLPRLRKRVGTPHGEGRVIDIHPMEDAVTVEVNDERFMVTREELIPLSEMDALRQAAASPCSKNETGGCDCGAKRPRGETPELLAEMGIPDYETAPEETPSPPRTGNRRNKKTRSQPQNPQAASEDSAPKSKPKKRHGGKKRGPKKTDEQS